MSVPQRARLARKELSERATVHFTPCSADELFDVPPGAINNGNIRVPFVLAYGFAVGGRLLTDIVPRIGPLIERLAG